MKPFMRASVGVARAARDAWLVLGVVVIGIIALELTYRGQAEIRTWFRGDAPTTPPPLRPGHPHAGQPWWSEWQAGAGGVPIHFDPYRTLWPDPLDGPYVNIDEYGRRNTYRSHDSSESHLVVFALGGSAMQGYTARDDFTIPSFMAKECERRGHPGVQVVNLAQSTVNVTQGVITLILELRANRIPDKVVFLDGINEVAPPFNAGGGPAGGIINQELWARRRQPTRLPDLLLGELTFVGRLQRIGRSTR